MHLERGFNDIGYHYVITPRGDVLPGRSEELPGAHARGVNNESLGVCCIGNFDVEDIPTVQFEALAVLVVDLALRYDITPTHIIGHSDVSAFAVEATSTVCPGKFLQSRLDELRARVAVVAHPDLLGSSIRFDPISGRDCVNVSGILCGRRYEEPIKNAPVGAEKWARVELWENTHSQVAWVGAGCLYPNQSEVGGERFSLLLPHLLLSEGEYECRVFLEGEWIGTSGVAAVPILQFPIVLPLHSPLVSNRPPLRADIRMKRVAKTGPYLVRLQGMVVNTGTLAWRNSEEYPVRIGAMVVSGSEYREPLLELRYDLSVEQVKPGQEITFSISFDAGEFEPGEYVVHVDVVCERRFWFAELGGVGDSIRFSVTEQRKTSSDELAHLLNPPHSWARSPSEAALLYIAPTLPLFDRSTGGRRLIDLFRILRQSGVRVTFLYQQLGVFSDPSRYLAVLDELGVAHAQDPLAVLSETNSFRDYNLCVIGWYSLAAAIMPAVRDALPGVRMAVDSVDIHWAREELCARAELSALTPERRLAEKQREMRAYQSADEVWVVSEAEAALMAAELPAVKYRVVGVPCAASPQSEHGNSGNTLLFVGGFSHPPNETAALWAAEIVTEYNKRHSPPCALEIVGPQPPERVQALAQHEFITVRGFVESLDEVHQNARAFLCPMKFGGGVKGKISDAVCRGLPVITNAIGNEGLNLQHGVEALLGETTEEFVELLARLFAGSVDTENMRRHALQKLLDTYGEGATRKQLVASLVAPSVVVGIVSYNKRELLRACLQSVLEKTIYPNFKLAVISNGCTDGTAEMLRELREWYPQSIDVYESESNDFFVRPCNQIIERYPMSDIVLMNNDIEVIHAGWLTNLVDAAYCASHVCGSGGLIFDPQGAVSEAGAEIYSTGHGRNLYRGEREVRGAACAIRSVGFVSGCLMYMRRDAIEKIGALDDEYHPMYFEDVAWHYTAHMAGLQTIYTPWARVIHKEGSTAGQDLNSGMKRYQEINRKKFIEKFAGVDVERFNYRQQ